MAGTARGIINDIVDLEPVTRLTIVDVDEDAWLVAGVDAWDGDERARAAVPATGDLDLGAAQVELGW